MKTKITHLREHLFETLEALKDKDNPMDIDRAKAVVEVAKAITETAKVEVDFMRVTGAARASDFIPQDALEAPPARPALPIRQ